jgi:uncharacterized glyoxalase superfamily protein PhnB
MDVYPSLTYRDVETALAFLEQAFGFEPEDVGRDEQGTIRHAALRYGQGLVLLQPDRPDELHGSHLGQGWVYVEVADLDAHFERARAAGAEILGEPHEAMGGTVRGYSARDPEGNLWSFGTDLTS